MLVAKSSNYIKRMLTSTPETVPIRKKCIRALYPNYKDDVCKITLTGTTNLCFHLQLGEIKFKSHLFTETVSMLIIVIWVTMYNLFEIIAVKLTRTAIRT